MTGVRLLRGLALVNLFILAADILYNVFGGLLPMIHR
jgi:hypothetical protein